MEKPLDISVDPYISTSSCTSGRLLSVVLYQFKGHGGPLASQDLSVHLRGGNKSLTAHSQYHIKSAMQNYFTLNILHTARFYYPYLVFRILETKIAIVVFVPQAGLWDFCFSEP